MSFESLGLEPDLVRTVADQGYNEPTPVQREAIPFVLAGRDVLAGAQTGTGKTAAFVLPILQRLGGTYAAGPIEPGREDTRRGGDGGRDQRAGQGRRAGQGQRGAPRAARGPVRVLVLTPTRELALQVDESVRTYGTRRPIGSAAIYGGVGFEPQVQALRAGPGIVVATPGRLLDHADQRTIDLSLVEILVLDEADRMLDMGFIRDIRRILGMLPARRQNLLFSATFSDEIRSLAAGLLDRPVSVDVTPRNTAPALVEQSVIRVDRQRKRELLSHLVRSGRIGQALVFTRTKHGASRLAEQLQRDGIRAAAIHGNRSQSQRVRALEDFKRGGVEVLVATDIAARGIDIDALPHVVNFELPMVAADYVHRIGRTGRAGVDGRAVSLVCIDESGLLRAIEGLLRRRLPEEVVNGFEPDRSIAPEPIRLRSGELGLGRGLGRAPVNGRPPARGSRPVEVPAAPARHAARPAPAQGRAPARAPTVGHALRPTPGAGRRTTAPARATPARAGENGAASPSRHVPAAGHGVTSLSRYAPAPIQAAGPARPLLTLPGERLARTPSQPTLQSSDVAVGTATGRNA